MSTQILVSQFIWSGRIAGSYLWDFGDGTTLSTGESSDSVSHQYSTTGEYEVRLIGYGCNGENDTVVRTITVSPNPHICENIPNYMSIGPNPVKSGENISLFVGYLPSKKVKLSLFDYSGKLVLEIPISDSTSTYIVQLPFSAGVYQARLSDGETTLEVEKILIY